MEFSELVVIFSLTVVVVALFLQNRSIPPKQFDLLVHHLDKQADKTKTKVDDLGVEVIKLLNEVRMKADK